MVGNGRHSNPQSQTHLSPAVPFTANTIDLPLGYKTTAQSPTSCPADMAAGTEHSIQPCLTQLPHLGATRSVMPGSQLCAYDPRTC